MSAGTFARHAHLLGRRLHAHRVDRLAEELIEPHGLHRPLDVARLQTRELEQVIDERRQAGDMAAHLPEVAPLCLLVDDVVADCVREQPQRRDRGAQVVRHRGDELAARLLGRVELDDRLVGRCR
jgi:hypothetical protein